MLRTITAALLATALIGGPALAAQPSSDAGAAAAVTKTPAAIKTAATKPVKTVKHARIHARTQVRHHVAHVTKPAKITHKTTKSTKSQA
jgi:hypothetical protein